ncbi:Metalloproteinase inhibitor 3-like [Homarus americanus]|uniref:Metalloproteinase inhibitor 3-like n=1 Tax=Homarus americanus TaxID=6706 RepID=A0A8J5N155_HOMAM|nr:Metalloproteinase inhibitor 3-like [Homarus americanus]
MEMVFARVRRLTTTPDGHKAYKVKVKRLVKGSEKVELILQKGLIYTVPSSCEAKLKTRTSHIITGNVSAGKPWLTLCNFAAPMRSLTPKMKKGFRLLYQSGCDCSIMSCHFWERCPKASFFCAWETSREKFDCQGRQSMCLRGPDGTCDWLRGHTYRTCMKSLRSRSNDTDINNTQDNSISRGINGIHRRRKPSRYGYKRTQGHQARPHNMYSRIGYVPKNG